MWASRAADNGGHPGYRGQKPCRSYKACARSAIRRVHAGVPGSAVRPLPDAVSKAQCPCHDGVGIWHTICCFVAGGAVARLLRPDRFTDETRF